MPGNNSPGTPLDLLNRRPTSQYLLREMRSTMNSRKLTDYVEASLLFPHCAERLAARRILPFPTMHNPKEPGGGLFLQFSRKLFASGLCSAGSISSHRSGLRFRNFTSSGSYLVVFRFLFHLDQKYSCRCMFRIYNSESGFAARIISAHGAAIPSLINPRTETPVPSAHFHLSVQLVAGGHRQNHTAPQPTALAGA